MKPVGSKRSHYLIFILLFLIGIAGVMTFRLWQVKDAGHISFVPQQSSFVFKPPSDALKGKFLLINGSVKKEPREKNEFEDVNIRVEILQGEKLATGEKSKAVVEFPNFVRVTLDSNTEIGFINLIPANFLISQSLGSVSYELLRDATPINVRSLHALITINSGKSEVTVNDETTVPETAAETTAAETTASETETVFNLSILNGVGISGIAAKTSELIKELKYPDGKDKYNIGKVADADNYNYKNTQIICKSKDSEIAKAAEEIKTKLKVGIITTQNGTSQDSDIVIIIGKDYSQTTEATETITVKVLSGKAKLALVDLENKTHIWEIKEGQKALINDTQRRVEIK